MSITSNPETEVRSPTCVGAGGESALSIPNSNPKKKRKRTHSRSKKKKSLSTLPKPSSPPPQLTPRVAKYWRQRYSLFSRYDEGVTMDEEGWYSVTPEVVAACQASRVLPNSVVIDCFAGVGGNAIQFALSGCYVVAVDIDPRKISFARNNARVYGVEDRIEFITGDFFQMASSLKGDVVFLSPPWGGPEYRCVESFTLDLLKPKNGHTVFKFAQQITTNIMMFLPRSVDVNQVEELSWLSSPPLKFEIQLNYVMNYLKGITVYYGDLAAICTEAQLKPGGTRHGTGSELRSRAWVVTPVVHSLKE